MGIQALHLFGYLPNMLELSMNVCTQGCDYCYAKFWKHENIAIDKIINQILSLETKKEGLLPFLIRQRSPITVSNRTDIVSLKNWQEVLFALKKLGFPLYIETKLNRDYKDLLQILDLEKDTVYQTITGFNNKHEERNILSAEEKIEAARWLNEKGVHHILAVNPYLPDKVSVDEIKKMIEIIKPKGFVMRDYHTTSKSVYKKYYMKEFPKDECRAARAEMRKYCFDNNIVHDIDYPQHFLEQRIDLNLRLISNKRTFKNKHFVNEKLLKYYNSFKLENENYEGFSYYFDKFLEDYAEEIEYFKPCIFKRSDYNITAGKSNFKWEHDRFDIIEFLKGLWNNKKLTIFDYFVDEVDDDGNLIYCKFKKDLII